MRLQKLKQEIFPDSIHLQRKRLRKSEEALGSQSISKIAQSEKYMLDDNKSPGILNDERFPLSFTKVFTEEDAIV